MIFENSRLGFVLLQSPSTQQTGQKNFFFKEVNATFEKLSSLSRAQLTDKAINQVFTETEGNHYALQQFFEKITSTNDTQEFEYYFPDTGKWFLVNAHASEENNITIIFTEITTYKHTELELNKAKDIADENGANTTAILEGTTDGIWAFDRNYSILYINNVFQREFQQAFGVLLEKGSNLFTALPEPLRPIWGERYNRTLSNEQFSFIDEVPTPIGTIYIQVIFNPIVKNGVVVGGSCFAVISLKKSIQKNNYSNSLKRLNKARRVLLLQI